MRERKKTPFQNPYTSNTVENRNVEMLPANPDFRINLRLLITFIACIKEKVRCVIKYNVKIMLKLLTLTLSKARSIWVSTALTIFRLVKRDLKT